MSGKWKSVGIAVLTVLCLSCNKPDNSKLAIGSVKVSEATIVASETINEIGHFISMHIFNDNLILINRAKDEGAYALFFYDIDDLSYRFNYLRYGRGPNEILHINPYYFSKTDSSFVMNTNDYFLSDFRQEAEKMIKGDDKYIANMPINNLFVTDKGNYICSTERRGEWKEFQTGQLGKDMDVRYFGDYPQTDIKYEDPSELAMICETSCEGSNIEGLYVAFYQHLPLIKYFDFEGKEVLKVELSDYHQTAKTADDIFNDDCLYFFTHPCVGGDDLFVLFMADNISDRCELLKLSWDGELKSRYSLGGGIINMAISDDQKYCYTLCRTTTGEDMPLPRRVGGLGQRGSVISGL